MRIRLTLFILAVSVPILTSCLHPPVLTAELVPHSLKAVNLEETISRRDELMMAYSLTSYDSQNKAVAVVNGGWGVEPIQKNQQLDLQTKGPQQAQPIRLELPRNGRVVASLVLIEIDDYDRAKQTVSKIQKVHNVVAVPAGLLLTATEVLTPLKYVSAGLVASGIGLELLDKLDEDDLLGQSSVELREVDLRQKKQRFVRVPAVFSGQNLTDAFEYQLEYDLVMKWVKIRPVRQ